MTGAEREACRALLGVPPDVTRAGLEPAFLSRNLALVHARNHASETVRPGFEAKLTDLRAAFAALHAGFDDRERAAARPGIAASASATATSSHSAGIPGDAYGGTKFQIRRTYSLLGQACWLALGVTWAVFALRLHALVDLLDARWTARRKPDPT